MAGIRAAFARSAADRDLHTHLGRATSAIRAAMGVCAQATRGRTSDNHYFRVQQRRLGQAEHLLNEIGHLDTDAVARDLTQEARALCSWLEGRERAQGIRRHPRRGQEYQARLHQVLMFLKDMGGIKGGDDEDESTSIAPPKPDVLIPTYGVTDG